MCLVFRKYARDYVFNISHLECIIIIIIKVGKCVSPLIYGSCLRLEPCLNQCYGFECGLIYEV